MEATKAQKAVPDIASGLLSKHAPTFNSTVNNHLAAHARYQGRLLRIQGATNIKNAAWLATLVDVGRAARVTPEQVTWDAATSTAYVDSTRFVRPLLFPLLGFAVPVPLVLRFAAEEGDDGAPSKLYVESWEEQWPLEGTLLRLPLVGWLYALLVMPIVTNLVLALSNLLFSLVARIDSVRQRSVQPRFDRAGARLPRAVSSGLDSGFEQGKRYGSLLVRGVQRASYVPLRAAELGMLTSAHIADAVLPVRVPEPYIFDATAAHLRVPKAGKPALADLGEKPGSALRDAAATVSQSPGGRRGRADGEIDGAVDVAGSSVAKTTRTPGATKHAGPTLSSGTATPASSVGTLSRASTLSRHFVGAAGGGGAAARTPGATPEKAKPSAQTLFQQATAGNGAAGGSSSGSSSSSSAAVSSTSPVVVSASLPSSSSSPAPSSSPSSSSSTSNPLGARRHAGGGETATQLAGRIVASSDAAQQARRAAEQKKAAAAAKAARPAAGATTGKASAQPAGVETESVAAPEHAHEADVAAASAPHPDAEDGPSGSGATAKGGQAGVGGGSLGGGGQGGTKRKKRSTKNKSARK